jgi:hypothetical protein
MIQGGASAVFIAFRDSPEFGPDSGFASEGVVHWPQLTPDGRPYPKRAFWALKALAAKKLERMLQPAVGIELPHPQRALPARYLRSRSRLTTPP